MLVIVSEKADKTYAPHFYRKLKELGWVEGKNISYVYVGSSYRYDPSLLPEAAAELVSLDVDVIYAESAPAVRESLPRPTSLKNAPRKYGKIGCFSFSTERIFAHSNSIIS